MSIVNLLSFKYCVFHEVSRIASYTRQSPFHILYHLAPCFNLVSATHPPSQSNCLSPSHCIPPQSSSASPASHISGQSNPSVAHPCLAQHLATSHTTPKQDRFCSSVEIPTASRAGYSDVPIPASIQPTLEDHHTVYVFLKP